MYVVLPGLLRVFWIEAYRGNFSGTILVSSGCFCLGAVKMKSIPDVPD